MRYVHSIWGNLSTRFPFTSSSLFFSPNTMTLLTASLPISLGIGWSRISISDTQLSTVPSKGLTVKLESIIRDQCMRNPKSGDNVPPNEPLYIHVSNVRKGLGLHPFCEVINSNEKPFLVSSSFGKLSHYVQIPLGKQPKTKEWIQDPSGLMNIGSVPLTLITLFNVILGSFLHT